MKSAVVAVLVVFGISASQASAAPIIYNFEGTLTSAWGGGAPPPEWKFEADQKFSGKITYDPSAISFGYDYISNPDWTLTFYNSPLVALNFSIDTPGIDYNYTVPTTGLTNSAWQYVAVGQGAGGWTGVEIRTHNYPVNWFTGPPSAPIPPSAYIGPYNPHSVSISLLNNTFSNPDAPSLLSDTSPDIDLAALHAGLIGPELDYQFSVRFSDSYSWTTPGQENLQAIISGRIDRLWAVNAVPEPASWAMMIGGMALIGWSMRRADRGRSRGEPARGSGG